VRRRRHLVRCVAEGLPRLAMRNPHALEVHQMQRRALDAVEAGAHHLRRWRRT